MNDQCHEAPISSNGNYFKISALIIALRQPKWFKQWYPNRKDGHCNQNWSKRVGERECSLRLIELHSVRNVDDPLPTIDLITTVQLTFDHVIFDDQSIMDLGQHNLRLPVQS